MAYLYDRLGRRRMELPSPVHEEIPTVDDYNELLQAYRQLHQRYEQQSAELKAKLSELTIREEALQRQGADLKQVQAEVVFVRAALQRAEAKEQAQNNAQNKEELTWQQRYEQLQAEVELIRKRWEQRFAQDSTEMRNRILLDMLPFADNLDLAIQHSKSLANEQAIAFASSIETLQRAFLEMLRRYGIERQEAQGKLFDPHLHEAIGRYKSADVASDHIVQVVKTGYVDVSGANGEKVVRPAQVIISSS